MIKQIISLLSNRTMHNRKADTLLNVYMMNNQRMIDDALKAMNGLFTDDDEM